MKMLSVLSKSDVRGLLSSLLLGLMALPAAAGSVTDANYTISASASGTQLTTTVPGAATFADSSTLAGQHPRRRGHRGQ
ncbi:MAG TPA: hypothetical protein VGE92_09060 [Steroidobacteraceae bacterium]